MTVGPQSVAIQPGFGILRLCGTGLNSPWPWLSSPSSGWQHSRVSARRSRFTKASAFSEWIREAIDNQLGVGLQFPETEPGSMIPVRAMGTNVLPALIRMMAVKDSTLKRRMAELAYSARMPTLIRLCPTMAENIQRSGAFGLSAPGINASLERPSG